MEEIMIYQGLARERLTVADTAVGFTAGTYKFEPTGKLAIYALCQVVTAPVRVCVKGTAVASTAGTLFNVGDTFEVWGEEDLSGFNAIRETTTSGALEVTYFGK
jgi:hypothetical protein